MASVRCKSTSLVFGRKDNIMKITVKHQSKTSKGIVKRYPNRLIFDNLGARLAVVTRVSFV